MDVSKILAELKAERKQIEEAILDLDRLARGRGGSHEGPPNWMANAERPKGRPSGSNDPGSQPPPAAPAAARIAGRLDRGISERNLAKA